jgi:hypothetical protein
MDPSRPVEAPSLPSDAIEFVRFCYRRRRVGWPELYDEMCAVAGRGLYRGWHFAELEEHGIGFSLHQTLDLARIAGQVALEEGDRRGRTGAKTPARSAADRTEVAVPIVSTEPVAVPIEVDHEPMIDVLIRVPAVDQNGDPPSIVDPPTRESSPSRPALSPSLIRSAAGAG